jgi:hypothetical protein
MKLAVGVTVRAVAAGHRSGLVAATQRSDGLVASSSVGPSWLFIGSSPFCLAGAQRSFGFWSTDRGTPRVFNE